MILENVTEYPFEDMIKKRLPGWDCATRRVDPRHFGLGTARRRAYCGAWRRSLYRWSAAITLDGVLDALMARSRMGATDYFTLSLPPSRLTAAEDPH